MAEVACTKMNKETCMIEPPLVIGLVGSIRDGSYTEMAVTTALEGAAAAGCKTQMLYLKDFNLPFCDGLRDQSKIQPEPNDQVRFRECLKAASGIIIGSPDYHGVPSGVLINAIDLTTFDEWSGKMVGLVSVSGGQGGGAHAMNFLRTMMRALHAWVIPSECGCATVWKSFDSNRNCVDQSLKKRLYGIGESVAKSTMLMKDKQYELFLQQAMECWKNPGGHGRIIELERDYE